jgi:hypothetical protein
MIEPVLRAWIEEEHELARLRVYRPYIRAFMLVAVDAGESQITFYGQTAVFEREQVINLMRA